MVLKGFLVAAVIFLIFSLLPYEAASQSDGPKATDKVNIFKSLYCVVLDYYLMGDQLLHKGAQNLGLKSVWPNTLKREDNDLVT